ncbi:MAG: hypothetical protein LBP33_09590, partial [Candidatus Adiutrix sp.]|nr:hypothetical protein [Candidatus Adiutrix sp.]
QKANFPAGGKRNLVQIEAALRYGADNGGHRRFTFLYWVWAAWSGLVMKLSLFYRQRKPVFGPAP